MSPDPIQVVLVTGNLERAERVRGLLASARRGGLELVRARSAADGVRRLVERDADVCLVDAALDPLSVERCVREASLRTPPVPVLLVSEAGARRASPDGAEPIPTLPLEELSAETLEAAVRHAVERRRRVGTEARFQALIENTPGLLAILDRDASIRYVSPTASRLLGYEPGEKEGADALLEIHPDDRDRVRGELQRVIEDPARSLRLQYRIRHRDGGWRVLDTHAANYLDDPAVRGVVVHSWDITEQVDRERKVRFQAELLGAVGEAVVATDLEGRITYWNAAAERLYGWTADEALGRDVVSVTPTERTREEAREILERLRGGESWSGEIEVRRKDGSRFIALVTDAPIFGDDGELIGVIGVSSDGTGRQETETALRERVKELRTLYRAYRLMDRPDRSLEERIRELVPILPDGWLHPERTAVRVSVGDVVIASEGFRESAELQSCDIRVGDQVVGRLEVAVTDDPRSGRGSPFQAEKRELLTALAAAIGERADRGRLARLHRRVLESMDEAVLVIDSRDEARVIVEANAAAERIFGYRREELIGYTTEKIHESRDAFERFGRESIAPLRDHGTFAASYSMRRKDGTVFDAEQRTTWLDPEAQLDGGVVSVVRDISLQKEAEERLRRSEERFRQIAESIDDVFWVSAPDESRIEYLSPAYEEIWGRPAADVYEDPGSWREAVLPSDRAALDARPASDDLRPYEREYRILRPDGEVRWILDRAFPVHGPDGGVERIVGVAKDVTERKRAEERFAVLSRELSDSITILGTDGTVHFASPSTTSVFGYTPDAFEGRLVFDVVHPEDRERVVARFRDMVHRPGSTARVEARLVTPGGEIRHVEALARNLIDHPAIGGLVVTTRDVTEQRELAEQLRQSQKMEAVGRLAGGIAHDFNNLLTVIRSQTDLLLMDLDDPALAPEIVAIQESADRAARLTAQLLAFSRDQVLRPRVVDLNDVVQGMGRLMDRVLPEDIRLVRDLDESLPAIEVDPGQLEQVILNLAINARDAMPGGGTLTLTTDLDEAPPPDLFPDLPPGPAVRLRVSDTGTGMDEATRGRVFEPFFTTKGPAHGTGLGLAVVYGVVKQSGGAIHLESDPGEGTTFSLFFPIAETDGERRSPEPGRRTTARVEEGGIARTVLLVEDDDGVRRVTRKILERAGLTVLAAEDAETGLTIVDGPDTIDLVVTDLVLPGLSGRELVDRVREKRRELPMVVMSGYAEDAPGRHGRPLPDGVAFLEKPFTPDALVEVVRSVL